MFKYLSNAICFILTSKWEDPGFVLIEAAFCRTPILSSDCPNGPKEILKNNDAGYLFKSKNLEDLKYQFNLLCEEDKEIIFEKKLKALKNVKKYTIYNHYVKLSKILDKMEN